MRKLTKLSLFSGIGGDDLASDWAGIETICFVEIDKFCQRVLEKHWPHTPIIGDIHDVTKEKVKEVAGYDYVDIIAGGDPCQPRSIAGKRRGKEDDRDLWPAMFRVIQEFKPTWVVNENPSGRLTMDFHEVLSDLESIGYETRSFVIPASAVNAPHRRDRLYIIAHTQSQGLEGQGKISELSGEQLFGRYNVTDTKRQRLPQSPLKYKSRCPEGIPEMVGWETNWYEVATALCRMDDGLPHRVARLKALGNAQVPQQAYPIYKAIVDIENIVLPNGEGE